MWPLTNVGPPSGGGDGNPLQYHDGPHSCFSLNIRTGISHYGPIPLSFLSSRLASYFPSPKLATESSPCPQILESYFLAPFHLYFFFLSSALRIIDVGPCRDCVLVLLYLITMMKLVTKNWVVRLLTTIVIVIKFLQSVAFLCGSH